MSSSAFFSKGIVLENENSMKILPCPCRPSPFLLLTSIALENFGFFKWKDGSYLQYFAKYKV